MPEVGGTVIIPILKEFKEFNIANIPAENSLFIERMFEVGGFNKKALINGSYSIEEAVSLNGYIMLSIFGSEWLPFAVSAMKEDRSLEFYGVFNHEHGTHLYFARNSKGESFQYWYEDDGGDESEQDDFDINQYKNELSKKEERYLSIIPSELKAACEDILPMKPLFLLEDE